MAFDVSINLEKFTEIESNIRETANRVLAGSSLKADVGDFAVERIKYQARIGQPFNSEGDFPLLKESTIKNRQYLAKYNPTHAVFEEGFSNLTITGKFLDSLGWIDQGDCLLQIAFQGDHEGYVGAKGQRISKTIPNDTLAKYLAQKGFKPFDFSLDVNKQFISRIKTICQGYIRRALNIQNKLADANQD